MRTTPLLFALALVACEEKTATAPSMPERITEPVAEEEAVPEEVAEAELEPAGTVEQTGGGSFVLATTALYRQATRDRRVQVGGKNVSNYLATLYRGERVVVLERFDAFAKVRASDETEGFVRATLVLEESSAAATIAAEAKTFKRPALVALAERTLPVGALLFVVGEKAEFSEVNYAGTRTAWVLTEALARDPNSYDVAKLLNRVRALKEDEAEDHGDEIMSLVDVARGSFPKSSLLPALVREVDPEEADRLEAALAEAGAKMTFSLHGSTPTLAWSPDGKKILVNAAYEYFGFDQEEERDFDALGLFIIDVESGKKRKIWSRQAYHPLWISDTQIAWGVSVYEDNGGAGLYLATLDGDDTIARRVETGHDNVMNTQPGKDGGVVYFTDNWQGEAGWFRYDPREDRRAEVAGKSREFGAAWYPPSQHAGEQCVQDVEDVSVTAKGNVMVTSEKHRDGRELSATGPFEFEPQAGACDELDGQCGPILPCVAPNGRFVAFIKGTDTRGKLEVEVHPL